LPKKLYALNKFCHYSEPSVESAGDAVLRGEIGIAGAACHLGNNLLTAEMIKLKSSFNC
jgi:hypothetical protein